jgi:hypothetical protein
MGLGLKYYWAKNNGHKKCRGKNGHQAILDLLGLAQFETLLLPAAQQDLL